MKMRLNLATRDLDASVAFYRTLLLAEPAKHYADYALFVTDEAGSSRERRVSSSDASEREVADGSTTRPKSAASHSHRARI
jgi:catechol 2,3-dioxygenase-like lactoylglutathione lyase family enzyme